MMIISFLVKKAMDFPLLLCRAQGTGLRQKKQTGLLRARTAAEKKRTFLLAAICYTEGKKEGRAMSIAGLLIRRERLARAWSQEGLCRGICGTSYLSKIEQGKAAASEEILTLLLARLGLSWTNDEDGALRARTEACMEALFSGDASAFDAAFARRRVRSFAVPARRITFFCALFPAKRTGSGIHWTRNLFRFWTSASSRSSACWRGGTRRRRFSIPPR